jgi:hypothetical protein
MAYQWKQIQEEKMEEEFNLIFIYKKTFIKELDRQKKNKDIENQEDVNTKDLYFGSKKINKVLENIIYNLDNLYLVFFLHKFNVVFEHYSVLCLEEEEINSLAMLSLYFTLEGITKDNFEIIDVVKHVNVKKVEKLVEKNLETLYFL